MLLILTFCTALACEDARIPLRDPAAQLPMVCNLKAQEEAAQEAPLHDGRLTRWKCVARGGR